MVRLASRELRALQDLLLLDTMSIPWEMVETDIFEQEILRVHSNNIVKIFNCTTFPTRTIKGDTTPRLWLAKLAILPVMREIHQGLE